MDGPDIRFAEGAKVIVRTKVAGYDFLPVLPARKGDDALDLKDGIILHCLGCKEVQPGIWMYEMEVVTGSKQGDTVWVGLKLDHLLEEIPSRRNR